MNKNYLYILGFILIASCSSDPELAPIISVDNAQIGAFPRTVNLVTSEYDLMDLTGSSYVHDIDFRSEDDGQNVDAYNVYVTFDDNNADNGDDSSAEVLLQSFGQGDFSDGPDGNKALTLDFPFTEVAAATGVALDAVSPGDKFDFRTEVILSDGRKFESRNTESTIFGPAFRAFFDWSVFATCPLPDNLFVGTYAISHLDGPNNPWATGIREANVTLALVPGSTTVRSVNGVVVIDEFGGFEMPAQIEFICDVVQWLDTTPGVQCAPPVISYNNGGTSPQDITDDSVITLIINEDGGGCGYSNTDVIQLTKV